MTPTPRAYFHRVRLGENLRAGDDSQDRENLLYLGSVPPPPPPSYSPSPSPSHPPLSPLLSSPLYLPALLFLIILILPFLLLSLILFPLPSYFYVSFSFAPSM